MASHIATNQTVSLGVYTMAIHTQAKATAEFVRSKANRIEAAYMAGEPIQMIVDEIDFLFTHRPHKTKTPRQLASRVVLA